MPIYEFICQNCEKKFDELVPVKWETAGVKCPVCSSEYLVRAVSRLGGFSSSGKMQSLEPAHSSCGSCSSGACSTCH